MWAFIYQRNASSLTYAAQAVFVVYVMRCCFYEVRMSMFFVSCVIMCHSA